MDKKVLAQVIGAVFIVIGLLGFINDPILSLFNVNLLHNLVHLLSGLAAFLFVRDGERGAVNYGKTMTVVYGLVTILGFLTPGLMTSLLDVNMADNILHLGLTALFAYLGFVHAPSARKAY